MKTKNLISKNKKDEIFDLNDQYMLHIKQSHFHYDELQYSTIKRINQLIQPILRIQTNIFFKANYLLLSKFHEKHKNIFYLYGTVGSGKSFITNLIYKNLPVKHERKLRFSFYEFIDTLRSEINKINMSEQKENKNNFHFFIKQKLKNIHLLCIDEFHVLDISDAMIILEFFKVIVNMNKMIVIINSNRAPEDLYKDGIHRERFTPVIDLINKYSYVMMLSTKDYREFNINDLKYFINFSDNEIIKDKNDFYDFFIKNKPNNSKENPEHIDNLISSKKIQINKIQLENHQTYILFDFYEFFNQPLYAKNYQKFFQQCNIKKIYINNLTCIDEQDDLAKRFIAFIDIAYEMGIGLVIGSSVNLNQIYNQGKVLFEFERTISRINVLCR